MTENSTTRLLSCCNYINKTLRTNVTSPGNFHLHHFYHKYLHSNSYHCSLPHLLQRWQSPSTTRTWSQLLSQQAQPGFWQTSVRNSRKTFRNPGKSGISALDNWAHGQVQAFYCCKATRFLLQHKVHTKCISGKKGKSHTTQHSVNNPPTPSPATFLPIGGSSIQIMGL